MEFDTFHEITNLRYRYALGLDSRDWDMYRSIFCDEVVMDFTSYSGGDGPATMAADAWVAGLRPQFTGLSATQHVMTNPLLEVHGGEAQLRMYMKAEHFLTEGDVQGEFAIGGYYDDKVIHTPQGWKIAAVTLTVWWRRGDPRIMEAARQRGAQ